MKTFFGSIMLLGSSAFASPCIQGPGQVTCSEGTMQSLTATGIASMSKTKFEEQVEIFGQVNANTCEFAQLKVHGNAKINNSNLNSEAYIYGLLEMNASQAYKTLNIFSNQVLIQSSNTKDIIIDGQDHPTIILDNTTVNGDIKFDGNPGVVKCSDKCDIKGNIINGQLKN